MLISSNRKSVSLPIIGGVGNLVAAGFFYFFLWVYGHKNQLIESAVRITLANFQHGPVDALRSSTASSRDSHKTSFGPIVSNSALLSSFGVSQGFGHLLAHHRGFSAHGSIRSIRSGLAWTFVACYLILPFFCAIRALPSSPQFQNSGGIRHFFSFHLLGP